MSLGQNCQGKLQSQAIQDGLWCGQEQVEAAYHAHRRCLRNENQDLILNPAMQHVNNAQLAWY